MELIIDYAILLASVFLYATTYSFTGLNIRTGGGPAFWPRIILAAIVILDLILIIQTYAKRKNNEVDLKKDEDIIYPLNLWITIISIAVYIFLMQYVGFFVSSLLFLIAMMYFLRVTIYKNISLSVVVSCIVTWMFFNVLEVPLPLGTGIFRSISLIFS